jgi:hypothetical protein
MFVSAGLDADGGKVEGGEVFGGEEGGPLLGGASGLSERGRRAGIGRLNPTEVDGEDGEDGEEEPSPSLSSPPSTLGETTESRGERLDSRGEPEPSPPSLEEKKNFLRVIFFDLRSIVVVIQY